MAAPVVGKRAPDFTAPSTSGETFRLTDHRGRAVVLYFYPRDATPGCTQQGEAFRDLYPKFRRAGAEVYGISRDTLESHGRFRGKHDFPFDLLSDADEKACKLYDVIHEKTLYGRKSLGVVRSTFLIDAEGTLRREWRKVKVAGHAEEVLEAIRSLD
ncbi:MAG: peroxiredoxin [Proteobacteria bacterium]|nr:MAG: peroxiredoxin [Pseudomonadota bacterium]